MSLTAISEQEMTDETDNASDPARLAGMSIVVTHVPMALYTHYQAFGPQQMPCGAEIHLSGRDQPCPNSGKCSRGFGECWVERYLP